LGCETQGFIAVALATVPLSKAHQWQPSPDGMIDGSAL